MRHSNRALLLFFLTAFSTAGLAFAAPSNGDYGDAPDALPSGYAPPFAAVKGRFPTSSPTTNSRYGLPGAHTLNAKDTFFGRIAGAELGPADCADPDKTPNFIDDDFDDAVGGNLCPQTGGGGMVTLTVNVTMSGTSAGGVRYINLLVDADHGGTWNDSSGVEWVVRDFPVVPIPGTTSAVTVGPFFLPDSQAPMWSRLAITDQQVSAVVPVNATGWDGSGQFAIGEIEDYLLTNYSAHLVAIETAQDQAHDFASAVDNAADHAGAAAAAAAADCASAADAASDFDVAASTALAAVAAAQINVQVAQDYAAQAKLACAGVAAGVEVWVAACASCQCASACAAAYAAADAAAVACGAAVATAEANAGAAAFALAAAVAAADAVGIAAADAESSADACASAFAVAQASASALASAASQAQADANATALALANAQAAACGGKIDSVLSAVASAHASAFANATAMAHAFADAEAAAGAAAQAAATASASASALAAAHASAGVGAAVITATATLAQASAQAAAAAAAAAKVVVEGAAGAAVGCTSGCQQEYCCTKPGGGGPITPGGHFGAAGLPATIVFTPMPTPVNCEAGH